MDDESCDLLCIDAPRAEAIRGKLLGIEAAERARMSADPITAFLIAGVAVKEGRESWRGESPCTGPIVSGEGCKDDCCT